MAKLKARGRKEIFRVTKTKQRPDDRQISHERIQVALMTDNNFLKRRVIYWRPEANVGSQHDYGWKVTGKIKAGLTAEAALKIYLDAGYVLEDSSPAYFARQGNVIEGRSDRPLRTEAKATHEKEAKEKRRSADPKLATSYSDLEAEKKKRKARSHGYRIDDGPGFYVVNRTTHGATLAAQLGPFDDFSRAEDAAQDRYNEFVSMSFTYLLPVAVIESRSRLAAEMEQGHVWWINGKHKGPPIDPRQTHFRNGF